MNRLTIMLSVAALVAMAATMSPESPLTSTLDEDPQFMGVKKCKMCHKKVEEGEQFRLWEESKHSQAWNTLATDEAKAIAAEKGIENPQEADECLKCHVTAHGVAAELLATGHAVEDGVGCESCHGAGGNYYKKKTMQAISDGEIEAESVGLITPSEEVCVGCHNEESPTFEGFDFEEASAKIAHPIPEGTEEAE